MKRKSNQSLVSESKEVIWSGDDNVISVVDDMILYTDNQKRVLEMLEDGYLPYDTPQFKMLYDILSGKHELKYRAQSAGKIVDMSDESPIAIADNPTARYIDAVASLLGQDFGMIFVSALERGKKGRKIAEEVIVAVRKMKSDFPK